MPFKWVVNNFITLLSHFLWGCRLCLPLGWLIPKVPICGCLSGGSVPWAMTLSTGGHKSQQKKTWKVYKGSFYRPVPWAWNLHSFTYGVLSSPSPTMWYLVWGPQIARGSTASWTSVIPLWVTELWIIVGEVRGNQYSHAFGFWRPFNYHPLWCGGLCYHTPIHV